VSKTASAESERLSKLLSEELELYEKIRKITEEQSNLLAKDDIEAFNISLDKREKLIEEIKGLHQESNPLMQSNALTSSGEKNSKIEELKKKIHEELEACALTNDKNLNTLKEKKESLTKEIDEKSAKRKGIGGYVQSVPNTPEMFDKKT